MDETSEQRTIELCRKGDRNAQKALFDLLAPRMYPVCIRYVGDRETAQDILQDGFVTMFSKLDSYKGEGSFEGWARRIFVNTSLMYLRKKDALKMSDDLENARHLCSDMAGQMENIALSPGDYAEAGAVMGTVAAPTKYYVVEGPNLYFEVLKDGEPVDPTNYME